MTFKRFPVAGHLSRAALVLALGLPAWAAAQGTGAASALRYTLDSSLFHVETYRPDSGATLSELTTELRPGLQYFSRSGRLQGSASLSVGLLHRSRSDPASDVRTNLSAALSGQIIEGLFFVDVGANVGRQALSAFGQQSLPGQQIDNSNSQEVATLSVSPTLRGTLAGEVNYNLRLTAAGTNTRESIDADSTATGASLSLGSAGRGAVVGWSLSYDATTTDYRTRADTTTERGVASLIVNPDVDWTFTLRGGTETSELLGRNAESTDTWGGSVRWSPSPRTLFDFNTDRRFFGRSHSVSASYRLPLSTFRFSSFRDVTLSPGLNGLGQQPTLFDIFFEQFTSQEPDPVRRRDLVNAFLASLGLDPAATAGGGFVTIGPTVLERHDLSWVYTLRRLTLSAQASASTSRRLNAADAPDASTEPLLRQRSYSGAVAYRLTPTATATLTGSRVMTKPIAGQAGTDLKSLGLVVSERLGRFATLAVNARYSVFSGGLNPYRESAAGVSLALQY